jgi:hypothetical protein
MYEQKIAQGVAYLDEKVPGWWDKVDLDTLELDSCVKCVLGQLQGNEQVVENGRFTWFCYFDGFRRKHHLSQKQSCDLGFALEWPDFVYRSPHRCYRQLTDEWREVIQQRREQCQTSTDRYGAHIATLT